MLIRSREPVQKTELERTNASEDVAWETRLVDEQLEIGGEQ